MEESMIEPSTMASGDSRSIPSLTSENCPPFFSFSSTSLTAEEPISRPTTFLLFEKNTAHPIHLTHFSLAPDRWKGEAKVQRFNNTVNCLRSVVNGKVARSGRRGYNPPPFRYLRESQH